MADITGTGGNDVLNGTSGADEIDGGAGNDIINAGAGDDVVDGGAGNDKLSGGTGDDTIDGGSGNDNVDGGVGDDTLDGGSGSDTVNGGAGDDRLIYNMTENADAVDRYFGGSGQDVIELQFTFAQWASSAVQADIARYMAFLAQRANTGEIGTPFYFTAFQLTVQQFETLEVAVDGVIINLTGNDAPTINDGASDLTGTGDEDTTISGSIVATDVDFDTLTYSVEAGDEPANGSVTFNQATGEYTYTPDANFNGADSFTVTVSDGNGGTDTVVVNVTIDPVNDVPAFATESVAVSVDEDEVLNGSVTATDPDTGDAVPDVLTYSVEAGDGPSNGSVTVDPDTGDYTYTPDENFNGSDSFIVTVTDSAGETDTITVDVTVNAVNDVPEFATESVAVSVDEDEGLNGSVVATDPDTDDDVPDVLTYSVEAGDGPTNGSVTIDNETGDYTYTPDENFNGSDSFTVTVTDSAGEQDTITVDVTVDPVNDVPEFATESVAVSVDEDEVLNGSVVATDPDTDDAIPDVLTYSVEVGDEPANGSVTVDPDTGDYTYTPDENFNGSDSFVVTVTDSAGETDTVTVDVTVDPVNDAPEFATESVAASVDEDEVLNGSVTATDPDTGDAVPDVLTYSVETGDGPSNGSVTINDETGEYTYTPDENFNGSDSFVVTVTDSAGETDTITVDVTVDPVNDAPEFATESVAVSVDEDEVLNGSVVATDPDTDDDVPDVLTYSVEAGDGPTNGSVTVDPDTGDYTYTPDENFNGSDSFVVTVTDSAGEQDTITVDVTVDPVNDAPEFATESVAASVDEDEVLNGSVTATDPDTGDAVPDVLTYSVETGDEPANGSITVDPDTGDYTYTPDANFNGSDSFVVTVTDSAGDTDTITVDVAVDPINDAPVLSDPTDIGYTDTSATDNFTGVSGSLSAADIDSGSLSYSLAGSVIDNSLAGFGVSVTSTYGKMYLNTSTGAYYFEPNDAAINGLPAGSNPTADFQFTASDGLASSNTQTLTVQLTGANEAATAPVSPAVYNGTDDPNDFDTGGPSGTVYSPSPDNGNNVLLGTNGVDTISADNGADTIYGLAGNDVLNGGPDTDTIYGGEGNDQINGGSQADRLYGGSGNDTIIGDQDTDVIVGGYGADNLTGDSQADTFLYLSTLDTGDTINGFVHGADKIDLSAIDANTALAGDQAFDPAIVNINAVQANKVTWFFDGSATQIWADVNGDTTADFQITLSGNIALTSSDFIL